MGIIRCKAITPTAYELYDTAPLCIRKRHFDTENFKSFWEEQRQPPEPPHYDSAAAYPFRIQSINQSISQFFILSFHTATNTKVNTIRKRSRLQQDY